MAAGIPSLSETLNTEFTNTWYEIRADAVDNILDATPVTALLRDKGCFKTQVGARYIERTIRYGEKTTFTFDKGDVLPVTEEELKTVALFNWAYFGVPITRSFQDDQQNAGPSKIKDYLDERFMAAREALIQKLEAIFMAESMWTSGTEPLSLFDYIPDTSVTGTGTDWFDGTTTAGYTYGGINRDNLWWEHEDYTAVADASTANQNGIWAGPASLTLIDDMKTSYNTAGKQLSFPDIILTTQTLFEIFETFPESKTQIIKEADTRLADLGYEVLRYKGNPLTWSTSMSTGQMLMLNSAYFDVVYDPNAWFDLTSWERPERQLEQVAYIVSAMQNVGSNPRFNARLKWTTVS